MNCRSFLLPIAILATGPALPLPAAPPDLAGYQQHVQPFIQAYCVECHGPDSQKAGLRLDQLGPISLENPVGNTWREVQDQILLEEMPPPDHPQPPEAQRVAFADWVANEIARAERDLRDQGGQVVLRRLNANEYRETLRQLLHLHPAIDTAPNLPIDDSYHGFDNIGFALNISPVQLKVYVENARQVLATAFPTGDPPKPVRIHIEPEEKKELYIDGAKLRARRNEIQRNQEISPQERKKLEQEAGAAVRDNHRQLDLNTGKALSFGTAGLNSLEFPENGVTYEQQAIWSLTPLREPGIYRFRFHVAGIPDSEGNMPLFHANLNSRFLEDRNVITEALSPEFRTLEAEVYYDPEYNKLTMRVGGMGSKFFYKRGMQPPRITIDWVEVEGPIVENWPSKAHHEYFAGVEESEAGARQIITRFAANAFRRPPEPERIEQFAGFYQTLRAEGDSFRDAVLGTMQAIMASPEFLFLVEDKSGSDGKKQRLDPFELASRLSYFLWSGPPDAELFAAAQDGSITDPQVLARQAYRMIQDPRADNFAENFTGQWLKLRTLGDMAPNTRVYTEWENTLKESMRQETEQFFLHMLRENLSITNFVDADFTMLNSRLAYFYGVDGVNSSNFIPVKLPADTPRGGLLTQGAILTLTSDGIRTSPVKRGAFILENIVGDPPPPPPNNVPPVGEVKGATLKERFKSHREDPACTSCHLKIDPLGFALENFNAIGKWRTQEEDSNLPVDPSGEIAGLGAFQTFDQFQALLLQRKQDVARCVTEKLMMYALGRPVDFTDHEVIEQIVQSSAAEDYPLGSIVARIILSEPFLTK